MDVRILGPLELRDGDRLLDLGSSRRRALLAVLLLHPNEVVAADRLIDELWGESPPGTASKIVQNYVSALRKELPAGALATRAPGYVLEVDPGSIDAVRFEQLAASGRAALGRGDAAAADRLLAEALGLWRGEPFADVDDSPATVAEAGRLEGVRLAAREDRLDARLALGGGPELVPELEALVAAEPLRERPRRQLMLALYRDGRQADALAAYRDARTTLVEELGLEPGPELRRLEQAILAQDPDLGGAPDEALPAEPESRRLVTALFVDLAPEAADPEALDAALVGAGDAAAAAIERHGGTVERRGSDALVGIFGIPRLREDDALRALGAALELRDASVVVGSGEVVGSSTAGLRPQLHAAPGEVLVGDPTRALVRGAARFDGPRLVEVVHGAPSVPRRINAFFLGREDELTRLHDAYARVVRESRPTLFTLLGPAGIGKSRLATELAESIGPEAGILRGRCLAYGDGITFWPLTEIVEQVGDLGGVLAGDPEAARIEAAVRGAAGPGEAPVGAAETFWAVRRLLEAIAAERPHVLVLDDLHWAEPAFLDLVEHVAELARGVPLLLLCLARPELVERRPGWGGGKLDATTVLLEPLSASVSEAFVERLASERSRAHAARIAAAAEGNPLFIEQMLAMVEETGELGLPPNIGALLAARLDLLPAAERELLQRGSVEGRDFRADGDHELLDSLVRKDLIRQAGPGAYRFRHLLIRDAAYRSVPKRVRAELHERLADDVHEELAPYHLEQAAHYRAELGTPDPELAARAAAALAEAADRARVRVGVPGTAGLYARAVALATGRERAVLLPALAVALLGDGRFEEATAVIDEALESGDEATVVNARLARIRMRLRSDHGLDTDELLAETDEAIAQLERLGDEAGLASAWTMRAWISWLLCLAEETGRAAERAGEHARRAGDEAIAAAATMLGLQTMVFGPIEVEEGIRRCEEVLAADPPPLLTATAARALAALLAMSGDFEGAREQIERDRAIVADLGLHVIAAHAAEVYGLVELLAGDPAAAERELRPAYESVQALGELSAPTLAAMLARAVTEQGRPEEAEALIEASREAAPEDDLTTQAQLRIAAALARQDAELAREAVELAGRTDFLSLRADALAAVARLTGGDTAEAAELYRRKGNVAGLAQLRR